MKCCNCLSIHTYNEYNIIAVEIEQGSASYPFEEETSNDTFPVVDEGEPSAFFLKEVREYLEGRKDEEHSRVTKRHTYGEYFITCIKDV